VCKILTHYFLCLGGTGGVSIKSTPGHVTLNLCFCIWWDSDASATQNVIALFLKLGWDRYGFDKKCTGIRYAELVFLHPVASVGGVVHSDASRACILLHYFSCSGGPGVVSIKNPLGHIAPILWFCIR
jgi:hypothetical protein